MIVVDASVAVKWFFAEPDAGAAEALLEHGQPLVAPDLIRVEVPAAIAKKARVGQVSVEDARAALGLWWQAAAEGALFIVSDDRDIQAASELALALRHPLQGCVYLTLAERLAAPLVTADREFASLASRRSGNVRRLGGSAP